MNSKNIFEFLTVSYATHYFYLGKINAINEGMVSMVAICLFTVIVGPTFWIQNSIFGIQRNHLLGIGVVLFSVYTIFGQ